MRDKGGQLMTSIPAALGLEGRKGLAGAVVAIAIRGICYALIWSPLVLGHWGL